MNKKQKLMQVMSNYLFAQGAFHDIKKRCNFHEIS